MAAKHKTGRDKRGLHRKGGPGGAARISRSRPGGVWFLFLASEKIVLLATNCRLIARGVDSGVIAYKYICYKCLVAASSRNTTNRR